MCDDHLEGACVIASTRLTSSGSPERIWEASTVSLTSVMQLVDTDGTSFQGYERVSRVWKLILRDGVGSQVDIRSVN
jgi:hypothetical protein